MATSDVIITRPAMASRDMDENEKYPIAPANPLKKEMEAKAAVDRSGVSVNRSAMTALFVFSWRRNERAEGTS